QLTIKEQRLRLDKLIAENSSLKPSLNTAIDKVYPLATLSAERETGLSNFPNTCPYNLTDLLAANFLPY
ncbi:MAG: DUF29 family protein, partial [Crocosphaera sp.]